ncbi:hypothetical protein HAX54_015019 [Datura stramonium]|uniref:Uncharacterized protein n=1 Tax=Datura stramonium TaxID=4076 RepID=A0ABS8RZC5_DATST|nr:hypothetical protein [Datura stramonium]
MFVEKGLMILINYATGCIFEYDSGHPLGSGSSDSGRGSPYFIGSFYSKTKAMVEELLKNYDNVCTLRVRMPISADLTNPRNFITKITRYESWKNFTLEEQSKVIIAPRSNNELDASKLSKEFPEMKSIKESLIENVFKPNREDILA